MRPLTLLELPDQAVGDNYEKYPPNAKDPSPRMRHEVYSFEKIHRDARITVCEVHSVLGSHHKHLASLTYHTKHYFFLYNLLV